MKRWTALLLAAALCLPAAAGCGGRWEEAPAKELWDAKPSVMVDGVLYGTTGLSAPYRTDDTPANGGHADGEITSSVEGHEYPARDDQSNFGTGYPYRYGEEDTIQVFMDPPGKWMIYRAYSDQ